MVFCRRGLLAACGLLALPLSLWAATEEEAARLAREGRFGEAATAYRSVVAQNPKTTRLRIELADVLTKDRLWNEAVAEYETALKFSPGNVEALLGIGTVRRWQGHIEESRQAFERARVAAPQDPAAQLGLAATYALDHDFSRARLLYDEAAKKWPKEDAVRQERYDFARKVNPRAYLYFEDDLSFQTRIGGLAAPFGSREEIAYERQQELHFVSATGLHTFTRTDDRLLYTHTYGFKHTLETFVRSSSFSYEPPAPTPGVFTTAIDSYSEIRVRYAHPFTPEQVASVRYAARPTRLFGGERFVAHKIEAEAESQWTPRFQTILGTGVLRDLRGSAATASDLSNQVLWKLGAQIVLSDRADLSFRYITNPDLDSSIASTSVIQAGYSFSGTYSGIARVRYDDYKSSDNENSYYAGVRITPTSHLWTELGIKYVKRGPSDGFFGLVSVIGRF